MVKKPSLFLQGLLRILVNEAEEEEVINKGVAQLKKMKQSDNVTAAISLLEEGLMSPKGAMFLLQEQTL